MSGGLMMVFVIFFFAMVLGVGVLVWLSGSRDQSDKVDPYREREEI